ncbi:TetR/AcrR family transcriptional regulator [Rhodococcus sp. Rp3]|uniref:TetR/AcrR family transcriptional regulator n=1 Tax=Rhodococcus sp. Rp3 TaxID=2807635 RepID=UPI00233EFF64|nr:TetR/AcrR family transcriptional regulator [Rhodococcus sp. Rp3]MDC3727092.1 TetR/AcrR family transcriptional regulator [Rhodococcus sp. Rp3]
MTGDDTRSALVAAGVALLEETGSPDVGLREIARRAGVSHGAPRRYFPTHRSLLAAIAREGLRDLGEELAAAVHTSDDVLTAVAGTYVDFARRRPAMFTLIFRHDLLEGSGAELRQTSRPLFEWLVTLVAQADSAADAERGAAALWVGIHGIAVLSSTGALGVAAVGVDENELIDQVVRNSLRSATR